MKYLLMLLVRFYRRVLSPMKPPCCRFYPTCSAYALEAISRFGAIRGTFLAVKRLSRCHPWNIGGVDYVPQQFPNFCQRKRFGAIAQQAADSIHQKGNRNA